MLDKEILISGIPHYVGEIKIRQPTLHDIFKGIGYAAYSTHLFILGMTVEQFVDFTGLRDAFDQLTEEHREQLNIYDLLCVEPHCRELLLQALDFFICGGVAFDEERCCVTVVRPKPEGRRVVDAAQFTEMRKAIYEAACLNVADEKPKGFYNSAAQKHYAKYLALKNDQAKTRVKKHDPDMELWNLIGAVTAQSPGYTLLNIWDLTIWQLYDQFGRINKQKYVDGYASKWAAWGTDQFDFDAWFRSNPKNKQQ